MENKTNALPVKKINWRKRVLQGLIVLLIFAVGYKLNVVPIACAKVNDIRQGNEIVRFINPAKEGGGWSTLSPDQTQMAYCKGENEFFVRDMASGKVTTYSSASKVYQVKYSPDGNYLVAGKNVLNLKTGKVTVLATDAKINSNLRSFLEFSNDGKLLALVNDKPDDKEKRIEIWNLETKELQQTLRYQAYYFEKYGYGFPIEEMSFSGDGRYLAVAGNQILLWEIQSGQCLKELATYSMPEDNGLPFPSRTEYTSITYSPDGKHLAAALLSKYTEKGASPPNDMQSSAVEIWNIETNNVEQTIPYERRNLYRLRYSPDGKILAVGESIGRFSDSENKIAELVDLASGQVIRKMTGYPDYHIQDMGFSADGSVFFVGGAYDLKRWKLN